MAQNQVRISQRAPKSIADSAAKRRWDSENTSHLGIKLNHHTDADIIARLEQVGSKSACIKQLIRQDIEKRPCAK